MECNVTEVIDNLFISDIVNKIITSKKLNMGILTFRLAGSAPCYCKICNKGSDYIICINCGNWCI